jgi:hypothetical protein
MIKKLSPVVIGSFLLLGPVSAQHAAIVRSVQEDLRLVAFVPAKQSCENWGFGAAVQSVLEMQNVPLRQEQWVAKLSGGEVCEPLLRNPQELARAVDGDYRLGGVRVVHLEARLEGTSVDPGQLVRSIRENRPFLLIWKRHTYIVIGLRYVETVADGIHDYNIQEMKLMDPVAGAEQEPIIFRKGTSTLPEVNAILEIIATQISG